MECQKCGAEIEKEPCSHCATADAAAPPAVKSKKISTRKAPVHGRVQWGGSPAGDWRSELKKKIRSHENKKRQTPAPRTPEKTSAGRAELKKLKPDAATPKMPLVPSPMSQEKAVSPEIQKSGETSSSPLLSRPLLDSVERRQDTFKYELRESTGEPTPSPPPKKAPAPLDKPLIRTPVKSKPEPEWSFSVKQKSLSLEEMKKPAAAPGPGAGFVEETASEQVAGEVLLSRVLAGIIDVMLSLLGGLVFAFLASVLSAVDFPTLSSIWLAITCAAAVFVLNSVFFLYGTGQTPGMLFTDLRLLGSDEHPPSLMAVLVRTLLFFPVVLSVVGLLWAVFDSKGRCLHDLLSGTQVGPASAG